MDILPSMLASESLSKNPSDLDPADSNRGDSSSLAIAFWLLAQMGALALSGSRLALWALAKDYGKKDRRRNDDPFCAEAIDQPPRQHHAGSAHESEECERKRNGPTPGMEVLAQRP